MTRARTSLPAAKRSTPATSKPKDQKALPIVLLGIVDEVDRAKLNLDYALEFLAEIIGDMSNDDDSEAKVMAMDMFLREAKKRLQEVVRELDEARGAA